MTNSVCARIAEFQRLAQGAVTAGAIRPGELIETAFRIIARGKSHATEVPE